MSNQSDTHDSNGEEAQYQNVGRNRLSPDMTIPFTLIGLVIGFIFSATTSPEYGKEIMIFSTAIGWLIGFSITIGLFDPNPP